MTSPSMSPDTNITPLEYFKEEGRDTKSLRQRAAEKNYLWRMTERLFTDLGKTGTIHAQVDFHHYLIGQTLFFF